MSDKINVWVKHPGKQPEWVLIWNTLEDMQQIVGGYIEAVYIAEDMAIICNEEGLINNLSFNCKVCGHHLFGDLILVGCDEDGFIDCPWDAESLQNVFPQLWDGVSA